MACCLTAPSHYSNRCWLIRWSEVRWQSQPIFAIKLKITALKFHLNLSGVNELTLQTRHDIGTGQLNTWRINNVVITTKRRHFDLITPKWRRFDVLTTSILCYVSAGVYRNYSRPRALRVNVILYLLILVCGIVWGKLPKLSQYMDEYSTIQIACEIWIWCWRASVLWNDPIQYAW